MSKLKTAATSVKSLASKIDDLKHQAKSLDEVIRALKKTITDNNEKESTTFHDDKEVVAKDPHNSNLEVNQENTVFQESSTSTSNNSSTEAVTMTTIYTTATDISLSLATAENEIGPGDNVTLKIDNELPPVSAVAESVELPRTAVIATSPDSITAELDMCEEKHADIQPEMSSDIVESVPKPDVQDLEDVMPMEH